MFLNNKAAISAAKKGKKYPKGLYPKISQSRIGRKPSPEALANMRAASAAALARCGWDD
jgi:hypothetical protein